MAHVLLSSTLVKFFSLTLLVYESVIKKYCFQLPSGHKLEAVWSHPYTVSLPVLHTSLLATPGTYLGTNLEKIQHINMHALLSGITEVFNMQKFSF